jgi:hypothetical protein
MGSNGGFLLNKAWTFFCYKKRTMSSGSSELLGVSYCCKSAKHERGKIGLRWNGEEGKRLGA